MTGQRAVFLDRDGVINQTVTRHGQPGSPRCLSEFVWTPGIDAAVSELREAGWKIIVVTNQPDLVRGRITPEGLDALHQRVRQRLCVDDIFVCPHDDAADCDCRKPRPGMLHAAAQRWKLKLPSCWIVGDTWRDVESGVRAGCRTVLIDYPYNRDVRADGRIATPAELAGLVKQPSKAA